MYLFPRSARRLAATAVCLCAAHGAEAVVLDFQIGAAHSCYFRVCDVQGFAFGFQAGGWGVVADGNPYFNFNPSGAIVGARDAGNGAPPIVIAMTRPGGADFSVSALDAATGAPGFAGNSVIQLVGVRAGGGVVRQSLTVSRSWDHYTLNGFEHVTSLSFSASDAGAGISVDNVATDALALPEPATYGMLLSGLGLVGLARLGRRRVTG